MERSINTIRNHATCRPGVTYVLGHYKTTWRSRYIHCFASKSDLDSSRPCDMPYTAVLNNDVFIDLTDDLEHDLMLPAVQALQKYFQYSSFRGKQADAISAALSGKDVFVLMPTGGGKSMCFTVPSLVTQKLTLVISPLIALMQDQVSSLLSKGVHASYISSTLSDKDRESVLKSLEHGSSTNGSRTHTFPSLLYITPELLQTSFKHRLCDLHACGQLGLIAVDEAHCISSWGHDFRPAYRQLGGLRNMLPGVPIMTLTATADPKVQDDIVQQLHLSSDCVRLIDSFNRPNIYYRVVLLDVLAEDENMLRQLRGVNKYTLPQIAEDNSISMTAYKVALELIQGVLAGAAGVASKPPDNKGGSSFIADFCTSADVLPVHQTAGHVHCSQSHNEQKNVMQQGSTSSASHVSCHESHPCQSHKINGCCIVYVHKRDTACELAAKLRSQGFRAASYSAKLRDSERTMVLEQWRRKEIDIVVATVAFGMGIDRGDVRLVLHWNLPKSVEGLYQESGRAGRDSLPALSVVLYSMKDRSTMDFLLERSKNVATKRLGRVHVDRGESCGSPGGHHHASHAWRAFGEVVKYCTGCKCRRAFLLEHFGEKVLGVDKGKSCDGCDVCAEPEAVQEAAKALSNLPAVRMGRCSRTTYKGYDRQSPSSQLNNVGSRWRDHLCQTAREEAEGGYGWGLVASEDDKYDEQAGPNSRPSASPGCSPAAARQAAAAAAKAKTYVSTKRGREGDQDDSSSDYLHKMEMMEERFEQRQRKASGIKGGDILESLRRTASKQTVLSSKDGSLKSGGSKNPAHAPVQVSSSLIVGEGADSTTQHASSSGQLPKNEADPSSKALLSPGCDRLLKALQANVALAGHTQDHLKLVAKHIEDSLIAGGSSTARQVYLGRLAKLISRCKNAPSVLTLLGWNIHTCLGTPGVTSIAVGVNSIISTAGFSDADRGNASCTVQSTKTSSLQEILLVSEVKVLYSIYWEVLSLCKQPPAESGKSGTGAEYADQRSSGANGAYYAAGSELGKHDQLSSRPVGSCSGSRLATTVAAEAVGSINNKRGVQVVQDDHDDSITAQHTALTTATTATTAQLHSRHGVSLEARSMNSAESLKNVVLRRLEVLARAKASKDLIALSGLGKMLGRMSKVPIKQQAACTGVLASSNVDAVVHNDKTRMIATEGPKSVKGDEAGLEVGTTLAGNVENSWAVQLMSYHSADDKERSQLLIAMSEAAKQVVLAWKACLMVNQGLG
ncbi:hypothetical protein CEUSTIGMA_g4040.t1 [Chlamydomonas eustigma]|uniref:DNA 3'-5' helicase n=1 Tax=Chlamydomonas eustigma TaxID=1157962 RepID=A0A250X0H3_9CHLO|nr:hypothetical protein CEUSTIGMA_g4040.t1 [Chlamydomonas eustigma]|eukprot:GAX76594.1 hypothetical protein CEUSTIGMA_g4040.t1 [Chlamydomonas eustigma]